MSFNMRVHGILICAFTFLMKMHEYCSQHSEINIFITTDIGHCVRRSSNFINLLLLKPLSNTSETEKTHTIFH